MSTQPGHQGTTLRIIAYGFPTLGLMSAMMLFMAYYVKYSTDVLLVPAGAIGLIFGLGRIWDAITDPMAGYWSDRTVTRWGRRRPWLVAAVPPLALFGWMAWAPPDLVQGAALIVWVTVAVLGFNTATTIFMVPHNALGAELVADYASRTRVFASREYFAVVGSALALVGGVWLLTNSEDPKTTALLISLGMSALVLSTVLITVAVLRERPDYQGRGAKSARGAIGDTFKNPHARIVFPMVLIMNMGSGAGAVLSPYVMHYVIGAEEQTAVIYAAFMISQLAAIPVWTRVASTFGKKSTWLIAMGTGMVGYVMILFVGSGDVVWMTTASSFIGPLNAAGIVIGYSVVADLVDWDELQTGERKEGSYYAVYHFLYKSSSGLTAIAAGSALGLAGFVPNQEQTEVVKNVITGLLGGLPLTCIAIGATLFWRYRLSAEEHARIRGMLEKRTVG